jgi:PAT family beta-lactamase induction signal transducer AmpG
MGFSLTAVGTINKGVGLLASLFGIFLGGLIMTRLGLFKSLLIFGVLQAITNLLYMVLALVGKSFILAIAAFGIECLCGGMGSAALVAFLMGLCNPKFTATQFALFSSLTALGRVYVSPVAGVMVKNLGWAKFYFSTAVIAIPSILLIIYLQKAIHDVDSSRQKCY